MNILHGTMFAYYTAKTRAYMSYKHIPFVEGYDVNAYETRIAPVVGRTILPVLETDDGEIIQDSTVIIDVLESRYPERSAFPQDPVLMLVTRIVEFFIDELWVVTGMQTRWNDPDGKRFASEEFKQIFGSGSQVGKDEKWSNGDVLAERMQSLLPDLGLDTRTGQQVIQRLFEEATQLLNQAVGPRQFAFGQRASLVDCCLYTGYFAHPYRDHGSAQRYLKTRAASLSYFIDNMHAAFSAPASGGLQLTDEFLAYLRYIGPVGAAYAESVMKQAQPIMEAAEPGEVLSQSLAPEIELFGQTYKRSGTIFSAWKAQRVRDLYNSIPDQDRERADELMALIGWEDFLATSTNARIEWVDYHLQSSTRVDSLPG